MNELPSGMVLPRTLADINADFMTELLRHRGVLDKSNAVVSVEESGVGKTWNEIIGNRPIELFTRKGDAFYSSVKLESGATCTLSHGDLRGDGPFFCKPGADYPDLWQSLPENTGGMGPWFQVPERLRS